MSESLRTVNVGLIGLGTVGGGVARLIKSHHDEYLAAYGIDPQKVTFIPNYVSGSVFSTVDRRQVKELRSSWGLDPERFTADMEASFRHKFATKPQVIEGNMKCLLQSMKEVRA